MRPLGVVGAQVQRAVEDLAAAEAAAGELRAQLSALQAPEGAALAAALLARPPPRDPAAAAAHALPAAAAEHALLVSPPQDPTSATSPSHPRCHMCELLQFVSLLGPNLKPLHMS